MLGRRRFHLGDHFWRWWGLPSKHGGNLWNSSSSCSLLFWSNLTVPLLATKFNDEVICNTDKGWKYIGREQFWCQRSLHDHCFITLYHFEAVYDDIATPQMKESVPLLEKFKWVSGKFPIELIGIAHRSLPVNKANSGKNDSGVCSLSCELWDPLTFPAQKILESRIPDPRSDISERKWPKFPSEKWQGSWKRSARNTR